MRNLLALLGLVIVLVAGGGWYLGWYHIAVTPGVDGHKKIEVDVNTAKARDDFSNGVEKVKNLIEKKDATPSATKEGSPDFVGPPKPANLPPAPGNVGTTGPVPFK